MQRRLSFLFVFLLSLPLAAQTINNDDSCDISLLPAATLLLPYFEVAPQSGSETTLFSIQNVSASPRIARVTIWTDSGYPLYAFNLYIAGYGVAPINLFDVLVNGVIFPGTQPNPNLVNPTPGGQPIPSNAQLNVAGCATAPSTIPPQTLAAMQHVLTVGRDLNVCSAAQVGAVHTNLIGYATIDVVANCNTRLPNDPAYYTTDLLFDNVLTGDYQQLLNHVFAGNSLVHIRAVPEGGSPGQVVATNLPFTFYDRLTEGQASRTIDRRQPLPSTFAARWIAGGPTAFASSFRIWRESILSGDAPCNAYPNNGVPGYAEFVRFDEHDNETILGVSVIPELPALPGLPATSRQSVSGAFFPPRISSDVAGWMWLNLNNGGSLAYSVSGPHHYATNTFVRPSQAWVVTTMTSNGYVVANDAAAAGNGCSAALVLSWQGQIGPSPNPAP